MNKPLLFYHLCVLKGVLIFVVVNNVDFVIDLSSVGLQLGADLAKLIYHLILMIDDPASGR